MKKILVMLITLMLSFSIAFAESTVKEVQMSAECKKAFELNDVEAIQRSGCCSWHQGVCGCSNGRVQCCDGTQSPSCTCKESTPLPDNFQNKG